MVKIIYYDWKFGQKYVKSEQKLGLIAWRRV